MAVTSGKQSGKHHAQFTGRIGAADGLAAVTAAASNLEIHGGAVAMVAINRLDRVSDGVVEGGVRQIQPSHHGPGA